jgi:hypothetical protein
MLIEGKNLRIKRQELSFQIYKWTKTVVLIIVYVGWAMPTTFSPLRQLMVGIAHPTQKN